MALSACWPILRGRPWTREASGVGRCDGNQHESLSCRRDALTNRQFRRAYLICVFIPAALLFVLWLVGLSVGWLRPPPIFLHHDTYEAPDLDGEWDARQVVYFDLWRQCLAAITFQMVRVIFLLGRDLDRLVFIRQPMKMAYVGADEGELLALADKRWRELERRGRSQATAEPAGGKLGRVVPAAPG